MSLFRPYTKPHNPPIIGRRSKFARYPSTIDASTITSILVMNIANIAIHSHFLSIPQHDILSESRSKMIYGLFKQPPALEAFQRGLDDIRIEHLPALPESHIPVHFFTDGPCS